MASIVEVTNEQVNTRNWIVLPADFVDGRYEDTRIDPARLSYNPQIAEVSKKLGLTLQNTAKDSLGRDYVGKINWEQALKINLLLGQYTMPLHQAHDFPRLLYQGMNSEVNVYNGAGKRLDSKFLEKVFYDMFGVKSPWRAEWVDADFKVKGKNLYINYSHVLDANGNLVPGNSKVLDKGTLMKDKTPGISLEGWLSDPTSQGLPHKKTNKGNLWYWYPRNDNNSVAGFFADSDGAFLLCSRDPSDRYSDLGVRAAKQHK